MRAPQLRRTPKSPRVVALLMLAGIVATAMAFSARRPAGLDVHSVRLIIDYNDGVQKHFTAIAWHKDMTVLDVMNHAKRMPHGISFDFKGSGEIALLTRIDDLQNQGAGRDTKNWLYWINTDFADKSFGLQKLHPSDVILWKFAVWKGQ